MTRLSLIQHACGDNPVENRDKAESLIIKAASAGTDIVALQEFFQTIYFSREIKQEYFFLSESIPGPSTDHFSKLAKQLQIVLLLPIFERVAPGLYYNSMVVIERDGRILGKYRKMHIPDDPGFYEKYYFAPGDLGYKVFATSAGRIGTLICWDQWYPEAARLTAMKGAEILVYPTAIGKLSEESDEEGQQFMDAWKTVQRSHAIANGCYVAGINRVGEEKGTTFWGHSFVCGPFGEMIAEGSDQQEIVTAELDLAKIESQRQIWPFFRDRRIDSYSKLVKRFDSD